MWYISCVDMRRIYPRQGLGKICCVYEMLSNLLPNQINLSLSSVLQDLQFLRAVSNLLLAVINLLRPIFNLLQTVAFLCKHYFILHILDIFTIYVFPNAGMQILGVLRAVINYCKLVSIFCELL